MHEVGSILGSGVHLSSLHRPLKSEIACQLLVLPTSHVGGGGGGGAHIFGSTIVLLLLWTLSTANDPPVVPLVAAVEDDPARGDHVLLELALAEQVVVALVGGVGAVAALGGAHDPGDEGVLVAAVVEAAATGGLFEGPGEDEDGGLRLGAGKQGGDGGAAARARGEVVDDGDADDKVGAGGAVGKVKAVGYEGLGRAGGVGGVVAGAGEADERLAAV